MPSPNPTRVASFDVTLHDAHTAAVTVGRLLTNADPADPDDIGERYTLELATAYGLVRLVAPTLDDIYGLADRAQFAAGEALAAERGWQ